MTADVHPVEAFFCDVCDRWHPYDRLDDSGGSSFLCDCPGVGTGVHEPWCKTWNNPAETPRQRVAREDDLPGYPCSGCNGLRSALCGDCEAAARERRDVAREDRVAEVRLRGEERVAELEKEANR